jgi:hypothetical protein
LVKGWTTALPGAGGAVILCAGGEDGGPMDIRVNRRREDYVDMIVPSLF